MKIKNTDIPPNAEMLWTETNEPRKQVIEEVCSNILVSFSLTVETKQDMVYDYTTKALSVGMFYLEFCDAIKGGDGKMVLRYWKYLLPLFKGAGRKIYSLEALYFLYHYNFELLPQQVERLLWSR